MQILSEVIELLFGPDPELREIIWVTLRMSFFSTLISSLLGIPLGVLLGGNEFRAKSIILRVVNTFMGLPPVVAGLAVFLILSRSGPLGSLKLLYSVTSMVIAQVVLITPIIIGLTSNLVSLKAASIRETCHGIGMNAIQRLVYTVFECRIPFISTILAGFGRAIAEVGAVQMVGGNIQFKTRVMTTAIMMQTNMGRFEFAIALGIVLLIISFLINSAVQHIQDLDKRDRAAEQEKKGEKRSGKTKSSTSEAGDHRNRFDVYRIMNQNKGSVAEAWDVLDRDIESLAEARDVLERDIESRAEAWDVLDRDIESRAEARDVLERDIESRAEAWDVLDRDIESRAEAWDVLDREIKSRAEAEGIQDATKGGRSESLCSQDSDKAGESGVKRRQEWGKGD